MIQTIKIHLIAAARPNFMKIAPLYHALKREKWANTKIVHTGQHFDMNMSDVFFKDLALPEPDIHLGIGGGSHAYQTGNVMMSYEQVVADDKPNLVVVVGDVNATMACALAAVKISFPDQYCSRPLVAHLEAGLRSFDRTMPEEINRIVTDSLADILWTPSPDGDDNLINEGVELGKIERVGNIMIDSFEMMRSKIEKQDTFKEMGLEKRQYAVVTLHRPSNVDNYDKLKALSESLISISSRIKLCFPVHPRTRKQLVQYKLYDSMHDCGQIMLLEPLNYVRFMNLVANSRLAITDSGGIQEETTYLGIPCLTIRSNTERPITITHGTNKLCSIDDLDRAVSSASANVYSSKTAPEMWDGKTAHRVVRSIKKKCLDR